MTQKVADQHEVLNRWREIADDLAEALEIALQGSDRCLPEVYAAQRRYEEARDE